MMKKSQTGTILATMLTVIAAVVWVAPARAQAARTGPAPFYFMMRGDVDSAMIDEYSEALTKIVEAHRNHDNGNRWATYRPLTGSDSPTFYLFLPMREIAEMDGWTSNVAILNEVYGADETAEILRVLGKCWTPSTLLLTYNPSVSNVPDDFEPSGPPPAVWHLQVSVAPGTLLEYVSLVRKIAEAHAGNENGLEWLGYTNMIGGEGTEFHFWITMDKIGDIDGWPSHPQVMIDAVGAEEWRRMQKRMAEITESRSSIMMFSPQLSHLGTP